MTATEMGIAAQSPARAKINLGLRILGRRRDGFHELRTVFQTISLADTVLLQFRPGRGIRLDRVEAAEEVGWRDISEARNLAVRAAEWAREEFGIGGQIGLHLKKRIPVGAGLGGGSADAAAVLRLLAARARRRPPELVLMRLAAALGSDVPALVLGGTVLGMGRGEECYRLPSLPGWHCLVAMPASRRQPSPPLGISTEAAYGRWDELHPEAKIDERGPSERRSTVVAMGSVGDGLTGVEISATMNVLLGSLRRLQQKPPGLVTLARDGGPVNRAAPASRQRRDRGPVSAGPKVRAGIQNDFTEAVFPLSSDFPAICRALGRSGAVCIGLSGSGAAQYGLFATRKEADAARERLPPWVRAWRARFVGPAGPGGSF